MQKPNYVPGVGPLQPSKLMIVAEAPGANEDQYRLPLCGPTGELLDDLLRASGTSLDRCYRTNVVKYRPPNNDFKRLAEIGVDWRQSVDELAKEIREQNPNCILALGDKALQALTGKSGIMNYRGSILKSHFGPKVVATFHPANLLYQKGRGKGKGIFKYAWKYVMIADMQRAVKQSESILYNPPDRRLRIANNDLDLFRFLREHESLSIANIDIESIHGIPVCVGIAFNKFEAISVPLHHKFNGVEFPITRNSVVRCWAMLAEFLAKIRIIGQNFKYDEEKLYHLGLHCGVLHADTLSLEHTLNPELPSKKLNVISSIRTEEPYYKDEGSEFNARKDSIDKLLLYNGRDCVTGFEVWEDQDKELTELAETYSPQIREFYYGYVVKLHKLYVEMERTGFKVDKHVRRRLNQKYTAWHNRIQASLKAKLGKNINVNSPKQMAVLLYTELNLPLRKGTGEDTIVQLMTNNIKDDRRKEILGEILDDRRVRKSKSTYINATLDYDGRLRTSFFITGTETGRSTTNILKPPVRPERIGLAFHTITKHGDIGSDIRRMLVVDDGYVFLSCDLSQAEARIVAVLSEDWELLKAFDTIDIHRRTAALVFGMTPTLELGVHCSNPVVALIGKESGERFVGKTTRHAGNYQMGPERFHKTVTTDARKYGIKIDFSEWRANKALRTFHEASPKLEQVFWKSIIAALSHNRVLVNPYGRFRLFQNRFGDELFKEGFAFIPQSTVHDTLTLAALRIKEAAPDLRFIKEDHDALTVLCPVNEVEEHARMMKKHLDIGIDFNNCSIKRDVILHIPSDFEVGERNYRDMEKLKL